MCSFVANLTKLDTHCPTRFTHELLWSEHVIYGIGRARCDAATSDLPVNARRLLGAKGLRQETNELRLGNVWLG